MMQRGVVGSISARQGYIFQNIGYLRGKPVVCILMDHPVYGAQFILKSKVMAAGLRQAFWPTLRPIGPQTNPPPPTTTFWPNAESTLKFQTNTKTVGINRNMYCSIFSGYGWQKRQDTRKRACLDIREIVTLYAKIIRCSWWFFVLLKDTDFLRYKRKIIEFIAIRVL